MAYSDVWTYANNDAFQGRCWAAIWDISSRILDDEAGFPTGAQNKKFAKIILRDEAKLSSRQLVQQVLRNATIAANPASSTDNDIQFQMASVVWNTLRGIG